jgi:hypothetical protein
MKYADRTVQLTGPLLYEWCTLALANSGGRQLPSDSAVVGWLLHHENPP